MGYLKVRNLGKAYKRYPSKWARLTEWLSLGRAVRHEAHWVLKAVNFEVKPGEAVGIIGRNGAGKSTLLKIIAGTTKPTEGDIEVGGRVAALLELGIGFHPDFTGRQNVYMSGQLLGFTTEQITATMPEIEAFAEIGSYVDEPLRTYSSGMQMRLAFSAITVYRPDILIVDEALAVGDAYFQHKCVERIRSFVTQGTTLLFVSHDLTTVKKLCNRALWIENGTVAMEGAPDEVVDYYNAVLSKKEETLFGIEQRRIEGGWLQTRSGTSEARVLDMRLVDTATGKELSVVRVGCRVCLQVDVEVRADIPRLILGLMVRDRLGHVIWGTNTWHTKQVIEKLSAGERVRFDVEFPMLLGAGSYSISPALVSTDTHLVNNYDWIDNFFVFEVVNIDYPYFIGSAWLNTAWVIHRNQPSDLSAAEETRK
jgi:lipopolysaccharide transport system ATP-binding protein